MNLTHPSILKLYTNYWFKTAANMQLMSLKYKKCPRPPTLKLNIMYTRMAYGEVQILQKHLWFQGILVFDLIWNTVRGKMRRRVTDKCSPYWHPILTSFLPSSWHPQPSLSGIIMSRQHIVVNPKMKAVTPCYRVLPLFFFPRLYNSWNRASITESKLWVNPTFCFLWLNMSAIMSVSFSLRPASQPLKAQSEGTALKQHSVHSVKQVLHKMSWSRQEGNGA